MVEQNGTDFCQHYVCHDSIHTSTGNNHSNWFVVEKSEDLYNELFNELVMRVSIIGERAKRARHSQVCSIENRDIYIIGRAKRAPHWGVQSRFRVIYVGMSVVVQKSVGGITWAKRAHAQSQYWAVKSYQ